MNWQRRVQRIARLVGVGLIVAAVVQELGRPPDQRTWHGRLLGAIPYDFRPPSWRCIREAYWNPDEPRLFTDRVFGVGWAINLHRAGRLLEDGLRVLPGGLPAQSPSGGRKAETRRPGSDLRLAPAGG